MEDIYQEFPVGKGETRLLVLEDSAPTTNSRTSFQGRFQIARLGDHVPAFTAISYAWANPSPASTDACHIQIRSDNDDTKTASLPLSDTLTHLFTSLLRTHQPITLWIDALCINQTNNLEKGIQVDQMNQVYSRASQVLVWLGPPTPSSPAAFRFMHSKRGIPWPDGWDVLPKDQLSGIDGVFQLLDGPWFRRVWVVQEVTLSSNVVVASGDDRVDFSDFEACVYAIWSFYEGIVDCDEDDEALLGLWSITRLLLLRDEYRRNGGVTWERLLQAASQRLASDSRDKVFAFKGLAVGGRPLPETDYGPDASAERVYTDTAVALLCHGERLDLLALAGKARNGDSSLPSWVPDHRKFTWNEPFVLADGMRWDAGGPFESSPAVDSRGGLQLPVRLIDRVSKVCLVFKSWDVLHQQAVMREVVALRSSFRRQLSEREWLDLLATSLTFGLDIDDQPADEREYRQHFDDWYYWLMSSTTQENLSRIKHNKFHRTIGPRIDNWNVFLSKQGYFGIGPPDVAVGDTLFVIPGCRLPVVLRPAPGTWYSIWDSADMSLVSWCFLHGIMDGEATSKRELSILCLR
ncbi:heterokaryon incompatibility protein-domain-containing protein [Podospora aff. communis PSN243]|uniref:Heterokaryon incompatibility protein-domain-containing protein n=1 Tax=Podospora aff. communis PSN243 TaxID=3040156 RepID=A0AAV9GH70_9PEZI|nr:heterokaryon incompatibility protein-domain-containing protein [Podospora aff. communis PSN243]